MILQYYPDTDMLCIQLASGVSTELEEVAFGIVHDFDENDRPVGIEIEDASTYIDLSRLELSAKYNEYQRKSAFVCVRLRSRKPATPRDCTVTESHPIGTLNEKPLHAALKAWYAQPGDQFEVHVDGFVVDIVRGGLLIEIQTRHFAAIRHKLAALLEHHPVRAVYPIAQQKWIVQQAADGRPLTRRKSPKRGTLEHVFDELVHVPHLLSHANFSIDVLFIQEEEIRRHGPARAWRRRGWVTHERRLLQVVDQHLLATPADVSALLPTTLPDPFTSADLAAALAQPRGLAQKMVYCLRQMDTITPAGKRGNTILYTRRD